ncbi:unnamed protein product [Caenorhabditis sp. 36 PRJEB53466]|nr:unnamed protein product [Caenorhabditis sp. 36 PRJEB53466]
MTPEDEVRYSYFVIDAYCLGRIFFLVSTCLTLSGLYFAAHPHYLEPGYNSTRTNYIIRNYKTYPNGTMYYEYPEDDGTITTGVLGFWFQKMMGGEFRFDFGNAFWNFCRPREVPKEEWMSSIVRSMNHLVIVQVLFRSAVLLTMTHSLFQCLLINYVSKANFSPMLEKLIGFPLITVEFIHNISLFTISCLHYEQDSHLMKFSRVAMILLTVSTVLKLIFAAIMQTNQLIQVACVLLSSAVILSHNSVLDDFDSFLKDTWCDSMNVPSVAIAQLIYFLSFFVTGYLQHQSLAGIRLVTCSTQEEIEYEKRFCVGPVHLSTT